MFSPRNLLIQLFLRPDARPGLPGKMIPGMQSDFMVLRRRAHNVGQPASDIPSRPGGARQQDVPAVERCRARAQHLPQKARLHQTPQVAPHVVRPDAKKEARLQLMQAELLQQRRHPQLRAPPGVDIDAQPDFLHGFSCSSTVRRKKSSVLSIVVSISTVGVQFSRRRAFLIEGLRCSTS